MKRIICLSLALCFLCGCCEAVVGNINVDPPPAGSTLSADSGTPSPADVTDTADIVEHNPRPIPDLKDVAEADLGDMLWWSKGITDGMYEIWDAGEKAAALRALHCIELLDKAPTDEAAATLIYEIHLKNSETVTIGFMDDMINLSDGSYYYRDYTNAGFSDSVCMILFDAPDYGTGAVYEQADMEALMSILQTSPCPDTVPLFADTQATITFWLTGTDYPYNQWYKAIRSEGSGYVLKRFFGLYSYVGKIGADAYAQLETARNGQFGTHGVFSVTSGGETIWPPALFVSSMTYHIDAGLYADALPRIGDFADQLETVALSDDFTVWSKASDKTWYKITGPETARSGEELLTREAFDGLPAGVYQTEVYITTYGNYIDALEEYAYTTDVYFFQVKIP